MGCQWLSLNDRGYEQHRGLGWGLGQSKPDAPGWGAGSRVPAQFLLHSLKDPGVGEREQRGGVGCGGEVGRASGKERGVNQFKKNTLALMPKEMQSWGLGTSH